jgi:hydroxymethylglutaryl-CoA lyase
MKIIECPRDAMQGLTQFIPTEKKIAYINQLLKIGFDTIDFGSYVSPKAIPQLRDTKDVLAKLDWQVSSSKLLAIVANVRGAEEASEFAAVKFVGFPLSISETFQKRNTNSTISEALKAVETILSICRGSHQQLVTYISMGFGNPYSDPYSLTVVKEFVERLANMGVTIISLADTIGVSTPHQISYLFPKLTQEFPAIEFGAHLHSSPSTLVEKLEAVFEAGCHRFDGAIKGWGGCPMADDKLIGNLATEKIIDFLKSKNIELNLRQDELLKAMQMADEIFPSY